MKVQELKVGMHVIDPMGNRYEVTGVHPVGDGDMDIQVNSKDGNVWFYDPAENGFELDFA